MLRRLALAAFLALAPSLASAQFATIGPTPAVTDNGDRLATTAWVNSFFATGLPLANGKIFIGSAGGLATQQTVSGDATLAASGVLTLATVNSNTGAIGSATQCVTVTNNAKGLTTAVTAATCTPAIGSITGLGTGIAAALAINTGSAGAPVLFNGALGTPSSGTLTNATGLPIGGITGLGTGAATALGVNVGTAGAFVVNGGVLGTPSSGVATNLTGTAAGLTTGNVTTNANLTGPVTSVGNATTIGANQVSRANLAQGIARSVVGVTGNATANVADIQGTTASTFLGVNAGGTGIAFSTIPTAALASVSGNGSAVVTHQNPTITNLTLNGVFTATGLVTNADLAPAAVRIPIANGNSGSVAANTTAWFSNQGNSTSPTQAAILAVGGTLKNMTFTTATAPSTGQSYTATLYTGTYGSLSASSVTCVIANTATSCTDSTHSVVLTAGQAYNIQLVTSVTAASTGGQGYGLEFDTP